MRSMKHAEHKKGKQRRGIRTEGKREKKRHEGTQHAYTHAEKRQKCAHSPVMRIERGESNVGEHHRGERNGKKTRGNYAQRGEGLVGKTDTLDRELHTRACGRVCRRVQKAK